MTKTPQLDLPLIAPAQAQKHVTHNDALQMLDALIHLAVIADDLQSPPDSPQPGDRYIVAPSAVGDWIGRDHDIAMWEDAAWRFYAPRIGWRVWLGSAKKLLVWDGAVWFAVQSDLNSTSVLGVNAVADDTNRFSLSSPAALFNHNGAGHRLIINKSEAFEAGSIIFQTGFSGRAEIGLIGDDRLSVKVSADGGAFANAITIDNASRYVGVGTSSPTQELDLRAQGEHTGYYDLFSMRIDNGNARHTRLFAGQVSVNSFFLEAADQDNVKGTLVLQPYGGGVGVGLSQAQAMLHVAGGVLVGQPAGGDRGAGTINAEAVYDSNTLLSCYVFDQYLDNSIEVEKWDRKIPNRLMQHLHDVEESHLHRAAPKDAQREHTPMRKFAARCGTKEDPLTLDGYASHWKKKRHLSSMPNEEKFDPEVGMTTGEWIQRLVETVEIQAILIEQINERLKSL